MSELMGVEQISAAYWNLKGYWVKGRVPYKVVNAYSDIDVLAYDPGTKHLVMSETKVRGKKDEVRAFSKTNFEKYGSIANFFNAKHKSSSFDFIDNVAAFFNSDVRKEMAHDVNLLTIEFVGNIVVDKDVILAVQDDMRKRIAKSIDGVGVEFFIHTTIDRFCEIVSTIDGMEIGKRFGDPILDIAREFSRFLNPKIEWAGRESGQFKDLCRRRIVDLAAIGCAE